MYKKRLVMGLVALAMLLTVTACSSILIGSGNVINETRNVSNFDRVSLEGMGEVLVTQGGSESLSIEAHENIMEYVIAEVEGGTLRIGLEQGDDIPSIILPRRLIFTVGVDDLTGLSVSGSGNIEAKMIATEGFDTSVAGSGKIQIADLTAGEVQARISGSGEIGFGGEAAAQDVKISGSGKYQAGDVCSASVTVSISGSGDVTVCATETLDVDISGSGSVDYYGRPSISSSGSGSGSINNLGEK